MNTPTLPSTTCNIDGDALITFIAGAATRTVKPIKITFRGRQGWSKDIGRYNKPGNLKPISRRFWLGHDQSRAVWMASVLSDYHSEFVKRDGLGLWTPEHLRAIHLLFHCSDHLTRSQAERVSRDLTALSARAPVPGLPELPAPPAPAITTPEPTRVPAASTAKQQKSTLYCAIKAYLATLEGKRMSDAHRWRAKQVLEHVLEPLRSDCPLAEIDYLWLDRLCDHFKARPKTKKTKKPMRPETVVTTLRYFRTFFNWIDDTGYGGWIGPRKLLRPFRIRATDLMTPRELRAAATIKQFEVDQLVKLYRAASDFQRTLMLTALFTGGTQQELAILAKEEFDLDAGTLTHFRNKTHIEGRFWLPPELVVLLRTEFAKHPRKPLAFYTEERNPVVWFKDGKLACDAVRLSWDRLRIKAKLPTALSFKFLRKFTGDYVTRYGGESLGQIALSHASTTVLAKNYTSTRDFDTFNEIQRRMHEAFKVAGMFEEPSERTVPEAAKAA
jgi:integrase